MIQNGRNDASKAVVEEFKKKGVAIRHFFEEKADAANARNIGVREAAGEYVAFLDDDDEWYPEKLELQVEEMRKSKDLGLISCHADVVNELGENESDPRSRFQGELTFETFLKEGCVVYSLSNVLIKKECFYKVGFFDTKYAIANDYKFYFHLLRAYDFASISKPLVRYHRHAANLTRKVRMMAAENIEVLKSLVCVENSEIDRDRVKAAISRHVKHYARVSYLKAADAMEVRDYQEALRYLASAVSRNPLVGNEISWSRFKNPVYRFVRPYLAAIYCGVMSLIELKRESV